MSSVNFLIPRKGMTTDELADVVAENAKLMQFLTDGAISTVNLREIAGYRVSKTDFQHKTGIVGLSTSGDADDSIRIWAGSADRPNAPFSVTHGGLLSAINAIIKGHIDAESGTIGGFTIDLTKLSGPGVIEGGTFRTAATGARVEISDGTILIYGEDGYKHMEIDSTQTPPKINFFSTTDQVNAKASIYYLGTSFIIAGDTGTTLSDSSSMAVSAPSVNAGGSWTFLDNVTVSNPINGSITGSSAYASMAGTAAAADSLAPSGNISWFQVTKSGSNLSDLQTRNLSDLTQSASYRTVTDTEKSTWNAKAPTDSPTFTGTPAAPTAAAGTNNTQLASTAFVQTALSDKMKVLSGGTKFQSGSGSITITGNVEATATITFPVDFGASPIVQVFMIGTNTAGGFKNTTIASYARSATAFDIAVNSPLSQTLDYGWFAVGS